MNFHFTISQIRNDYETNKQRKRETERNIMNAREDLLYTESHEWIKEESDGYLVGISEHAAKELGDIVYIELPTVDDDVQAGDSICEVESVKSVSEIIAPLTGKIIEVNDELADAPGDINTAPYDSWIFKISGEPPVETMTPEEYTAFCEGN